MVSTGASAPFSSSTLRSPENMIDDVYKAVKQIIAMDKFLVVLGGEHSVSSGIAKAYCEKLKNLTVLQIDAHADLRDEYGNTTYNHACTENIYIGIDADGFDPSIIPATRSPVLGGLQWYESVDLFRKLFKEENVVGFDFVELSSKGGEQDTRLEDTAATLIYRLIGYQFLR